MDDYCMSIGTSMDEYCMCIGMSMDEYLINRDSMDD